MSRQSLSQPWERGFQVFESGLTHLLRVVFEEVPHPVDVADKPAVALFVHQLRERPVKLPEIRLILPGLLGLGVFAVRDAAPGPEGVPGAVYVRFIGLPQVTSRQYRQDTLQSLAL